jgi:hypothetical protein
MKAQRQAQFFHGMLKLGNAPGSENKKRANDARQDS